MADTDPREVERKLFKAIEDDRIGMLGLMGGEGGHFQPMTAFWEEETHSLWFYSYKDSDLARAAAEGRPAMFTFQNKDVTIWACIGGEMHEHCDRAPDGVSAASTVLCLEDGGFRLDHRWRLDARSLAWFAAMAGLGLVTAALFV